MTPTSKPESDEALTVILKVRISESLDRDLEKWIAAQKFKLTRSDAVRYILEQVVSKPKQK